MPLLLLIRHGENDYVKTGRMAGRLPDVHLNERGRAQSVELAEALAQAPIKALYSSPMERAMETAAPLAENTDVVAVGLGVIPANEAEQGRLAGAIRPNDGPSLASADSPCDVAKDRFVAVGNADIAHLDDRFTG